MSYPSSWNVLSERKLMYKEIDIKIGVVAISNEHVEAIVMAACQAALRSTRNVRLVSDGERTWVNEDHARPGQSDGSVDDLQ